MKKLQQLFDEIIKIDGVNKAKVLSWAEDIKPRFKSTAIDDGFVLTYTATFLIQSLSQDNQVMERVTMFLSGVDRDDLEPVFNTDVINNGKIDLMLEIELIEQANLIPGAGDWVANGVNCELVYEGFDVLNNVTDFDGADHKR